MIRTPLRPLAQILLARQAGQNPDMIERDNLAKRHDIMRESTKGRSQLRLAVLALAFFAAFATIVVRMGMLAASEPVEPRLAGAESGISAGRADLTDRNGRMLATNMVTHALYAHPKDMIDPVRVAKELALIFSDFKVADLERRFTDGRNFLWLRKVLSPEQMQAVHDIGDPGLLFGPREMRLYPNGRLAAHILGGASFGQEGVNAAQVIGMAGLEYALDSSLRDPSLSNQPVALSIDLTVQDAVAEVLASGMTMLDAKGAAAVLMDVDTGEVISLVSLPDFDPNDRPRPILGNDPALSPLFNRAVQGVYELGSTFKIFAVAQALELGLVTPDTMVDADAPMTWGRFRISEYEGKNYGPLLSVADVIAKSSNVGTAHIALEIGAERQKAFLQSLGLLDLSPVELSEARGTYPLVPKNWSEITTITASYGHGIATSPLHLAAAYSTIANGGILVRPSLLRDHPLENMPRILSEKSAAQAVGMLRGVVTRGTATFADVDGYQVAGKTGTADKPNPQGGYYKNRVINTFASLFPASNPKYVLIVTLDEPVDNTGPKPRRTAGYTAVPVAGEIIRRVAPLLGLRPGLDLAQETVVKAVISGSINQ
ncbi:MAG TPA: cell division protein FtsI [Rhodobacter sp.]|nr:penicillin-binding protein 2 [Paracoccaceae bacterium]MDO7654775.1 penicillin-binding protein 2 [Paracoccaceae bacterium]HAQ47133.1 cell division protein FtsI [Rhodobacter sp.]